MEPFLGQIMWAGFPFAPQGWASCNGAVMPLEQNVALFSLLGTSFGGDGRTTFGLPDLGGAVAVGTSATRPIGQTLALGGPGAGAAAATGLVVPASIALQGIYPPRN